MTACGDTEGCCFSFENDVFSKVMLDHFTLCRRANSAKPRKEARKEASKQGRKQASKEGSKKRSKEAKKQGSKEEQGSKEAFGFLLQLPCSNNLSWFMNVPHSRSP